MLSQIKEESEKKEKELEKKNKEMIEDLNIWRIKNKIKTIV